MHVFEEAEQLVSPNSPQEHADEGMRHDGTDAAITVRRLLRLVV